jgi:hypothetical protein
MYTAWETQIMGDKARWRKSVAVGGVLAGKKGS